MDMYLPVVPFMADALGSGAGTIQLTLTAYLVLLGAGQLLFGPLSDRLGRRPVLLGGGIAYIAASFGLTVVSSPELFLSFRVLQACGASACPALRATPQRSGRVRITHRRGVAHQSPVKVVSNLSLLLTACSGDVFQPRVRQRSGHSGAA